jgi:diaminopimelate decarboxylase
VNIPDRVAELAVRAQLPAYIYDLTGLGPHAAAIRACLPSNVGFYYAIKANPDPEILRALVPHVDGFEVSSGGELRHVTNVAPEMPVAFSGPGKTTAELAAAVSAGALVHVESPRELTALASEARSAGRKADILLRLNPPPAPLAGANVPSTPGPSGPQLVMGGVGSPFGMDLEEAGRCLGLIGADTRVLGVHAHVASGLDAGAALDVAERVAGLADDIGYGGLVNCGGGMGVDYREPGRLFDWGGYGAGLGKLGRPLRIEPGRAVTAYCGWYVTRVLDVKTSYGETFAIVAGGTHHLRTPAAKGHDQPCVILGDPRPGTVTYTGQLCTPKDVLARNVAGRPRVGDIVAFGMAGAYAWNISHQRFLMHPEPSFGYV